MKRFSFKTLLLVVVLAALLLVSVVTPETSRVRALKYIDQTKGTKVELSESSLSENDPRRWIFGKDAGRHIKKLEFPSGLDYAAESLSIEKIIRNSRSLSHLESLALRSKLPITKKTIESLGRLKALRFVWIELAEIDEEAVLAISQLENLEVLLLHTCRFTTEDFSSFSKLTHLTTVNISRNPDLTEQVTDRALESFRNSAPTAYVQLSYPRAFRQQKRKEHYEKIKQNKELR